MRLINFYIDPTTEQKLLVLARISDRDDKSKEMRALINAEWERQVQAGRVSNSMLDTHDQPPAGCA